jgi:hypothetical protein
MDWRFEKHYTLAEARELLPLVKEWLDRLVQLRGDLEYHEERLEKLRNEGADLGGASVNGSTRCLAEIKAVVTEFYRRQIQIKDLDRGLIDFPAFLGDKEVFLCWKKGEEDIRFWHDLDAGYAGRQPLEEE